MIGLLLAVTPSPGTTSVPAGGGSPGFLGFVFTFALAIAAVFLFLSLTRQLRRVDRRARQQEADDAAAAALVASDAVVQDEPTEPDEGPDAGPAPTGDR
ncbi:hypothetical protein [Cellulomonas composti]|uniref:Uncharacterized protein n=1 Tax=Cellulomonas composti TaxID=266130 RepID=A0A511JA96_9CELL|nr:hypothetical protein [Cellulomonas composti]GEL94917.1 hypothetical protein CCO02nite_15750 [Cellulomonas composti]